jgi:glycolate oxidase FAD binding subunit
MQAVIDALREQVLAAQSDRRPLEIRGGGTKAFYGEAPTGEVLDTRALSGVLSYEPTELVITALAGTPLAEIERVLAEQNQMLAFEPPHFGPGATLGGCVAAGLSGPRRATAGAVRDFVLGAKLLDAQGRVLSFGGQVMKNVAGYDISRLLAGSLGILGVIVEVSLKVLPRPLHEVHLHWDCNEADAIARMNAWAAEPHPISASAWVNGELRLRLSGAPAAVEASCSKLGGDLMPSADGEAFWTALREQTHPFFAVRPLWRLGLPSRTPPLALGPTLIEWGGAQRWLAHDDEAIVRAELARLGGHASCFRRGSSPVASVFQPLAPAVAQLHKRLKAELDPLGLFNPGRLYAGL